MSIGVVVVTRNRPRLLMRCLQSLAEQSRPPDQVVVVDDASSEPVPDIEDQLGDVLPVRLLRLETQGGPARGRNEGWRALETDQVAFTDDDCRPSSGWLAALEAAAGSEQIVVGPTHRDPHDGPLTSSFDRTMEVTGAVGRFSTCNVLFPRRLLEQLGGFDEQFHFPYGEDTDLGRRALRAGAVEVYAPAAVVLHAVHRSGPGPTLRERWRSGEVVRLVRRYPELRREMWRGWYWKDHHPLVLTALSGMALTPLSPVFALLAGPWVEDAVWRMNNDLDTASMSRPKKAKELAGLFLLDSVEVASFAWNSLRYRTLFL